MARIARVSAEDTQEDVARALGYTRTMLAELAGRETERMIEPLELYAHLPELLHGVGMMAQATAQLHGVDRRYHALAQLKAATLTHCEYCIDIGSQVSRRWGLTNEELLALPNHRTSPLFSDLDKLVLEYAVGMSRTPVEVSDALFDALRRHFSDAQLVELTHLIAVENMYGRFNHALGVGSAGFSEGMVCAVPAAVEATA
jgi:4-carboxymuconolactone decarboxylase